MCAIIGALLFEASAADAVRANNITNTIFTLSMERGRDGRGFYAQRVPHGHAQIETATWRRDARRAERWDDYVEFFAGDTLVASLIGNLRAEPTTEHIKDKKDHDQQPYRLGQWNIVHNGTIANDAELRSNKLPTAIDSAAIVELLAQNDLIDYSADEVAQYFADCITHLKGSYAILATHEQHPSMMLVAANYRPVWYAKHEGAIYFASSRDYFPPYLSAQMIPPYTAWAFTNGLEVQLQADLRPAQGKRALVVCSGGMDSVVAAVAAQRIGYEIELINFQYGSRAETPEVKAIIDVGQHLGVPYHFHAISVYEPSDSPLLQSDSKLAGGEEGAEFAHEWVPARNLLMLATATAMAEAKGFDTLVLGNNLEEAGAYPDNEPEFIQRFNDLLPFAVGDGKRMQVIMPVGKLMKHEIVALGLQLGAPLHLTWSCYRANHLHCGKCGPCYMRRTAFAINNQSEVIEYEGYDNVSSN